MDEIVTPPQPHHTVSEQERLSLLRRAVYAFGGTIMSFALVVYVLLAETAGTLAERVVNGAFAFAELCAMLYMGASVIDRTKLVDKVSDYWSRPADRADYSVRSARRAPKPDDHEDMR